MMYMSVKTNKYVNGHNKQTKTSLDKVLTGTTLI